jgi:hypothetical protein
MKNKKINYTEKGYSYIKCNENDCYNWGGAAICDHCGKKMHNSVYLIFVLGSAYCSHCFNNWIRNSKRYEDDIELQNENHIKWYKMHQLEIAQ